MLTVKTTRLPIVSTNCTAPTVPPRVQPKKKPSNKSRFSAENRARPAVSEASHQVRWSMASRRGVVSSTVGGGDGAAQSLGGSGGGDGGDDDKKIKPLASEPKLAGTQTGTLGHAQHMVDLLLDIVPGTSDGTYPALDQYVSFTRDLVRQIKNKKIDEVNEKFDGSTSILLGFDAAGRPFVAYKHGLKKDGESVIVRDADEALSRFKGSPMGRMFAAVIEHLKDVMKNFPVKDVIFQGDMLFSPEKDRRKMKPRSVKFKANRLEYDVKKGSPYFDGIRTAKVGVAIHSIASRVLHPETGNVTQSTALDNDKLVADFVKAVNGGDVFAVDPWSRDVGVDLDSLTEFNANKEARFEAILAGIEENYRSLSREFRASWKTFKPDFDVFLNTGLKVGKRGGIYRAAKAGEPFDYEYLKAKLLKWYQNRTQTLSVSEDGSFETLTKESRVKKFEKFLMSHEAEFKKFTEAYYDAIRIEYLLRWHLKEMYRSKLGGDKIEGVMLTDSKTRVKIKFVDRLDFSMANFENQEAHELRKRLNRVKKRLEAVPVDLVPVMPLPEGVYPQPFDQWRAGAVFYVTKFQPLHPGHIAVIAHLAAKYGAENVFVVASSKAPNFKAGDYKKFGAAETLDDLKEWELKHPFSNDLRDELFRHGIPQGVNYFSGDTRGFWSYVNRAGSQGATGKIIYALGEKEAARYTAQESTHVDLVDFEFVPMQADGLSATEVRSAVRALARKNKPNALDYKFLFETALAYVPETERAGIIGRMVHEYLDAVAYASQFYLGEE